MNWLYHSCTEVTWNSKIEFPSYLHVTRCPLYKDPHLRLSDLSNCRTQTNAVRKFAVPNCPTFHSDWKYLNERDDSILTIAKYTSLLPKL